MVGVCSCRLAAHMPPLPRSKLHFCTAPLTVCYALLGCHPVLADTHLHPLCATPFPAAIRSSTAIDMPFPAAIQSPQTLISALEQLYNLGALDEEGLLTRLGRKMAEFPLDPPVRCVSLHFWIDWESVASCSEGLVGGLGRKRARWTRPSGAFPIGCAGLFHGFGWRALPSTWGAAQLCGVIAHNTCCLFCSSLQQDAHRLSGPGVQRGGADDYWNAQRPKHLLPVRWMLALARCGVVCSALLP